MAYGLRVYRVRVSGCIAVRVWLALGAWHPRWAGGLGSSLLFRAFSSDPENRIPSAGVLNVEHFFLYVGPAGILRLPRPKLKPAIFMEVLSQALNDAMT